MDKRTFINIVVSSPEKVAEFLIGQEEAFIAFLETKNKEERIAFLEKKIAEVPKIQEELNILKSKV